MSSRLIEYHNRAQVSCRLSSSQFIPFCVDPRSLPPILPPSLWFDLMVDTTEMGAVDRPRPAFWLMPRWLRTSVKQSHGPKDRPQSTGRTSGPTYLFNPPLVPERALFRVDMRYRARRKNLASISEPVLDRIGATANVAPV